MYDQKCDGCVFVCMWKWICVHEFRNWNAKSLHKLFHIAFFMNNKHWIWIIFHHFWRNFTTKHNLFLFNRRWNAVYTIQSILFICSHSFNDITHFVIRHLNHIFNNNNNKSKKKNSIQVILENAQRARYRCDIDVNVYKFVCSHWKCKW